MKGFAFRVLSQPWVSVVLSVLLFVAIGASSAYAYIVFSRPSPMVAPIVSNQPSSQYKADRSAEARLLGAEDEDDATPPNLQLLGVAAGTAGNGAAVLSVDGQPAVHAVPGDMVVNGWKLSEVFGDKVVLVKAGQQHTLTLPSQPPIEGMIEHSSAAAASY
jgi:type II secretory pathway component PulC